MAMVAGKPSPVLQSIAPKSGLKLLAIDFAGPLTETYLPSNFTAKDYPGLVGRRQGRDHRGRLGHGGVQLESRHRAL